MDIAQFKSVSAVLTFCRLDYSFLSLIRLVCVFYLSFLSDWMRCEESRDWYLKYIKLKQTFRSVPSGCMFELRSSVMLPGYLMNSRSKAGPCPWPLADREIRPAGMLCIFQVLFQRFTEPRSLIRAEQLLRPMDLMIISVHALKCTHSNLQHIRTKEEKTSTQFTEATDKIHLIHCCKIWGNCSETVQHFLNYSSSVCSTRQ